MVETAQAIVHLTIRNHARQQTDALDTRINSIAALAVGTTWKPKCAATEKVSTVRTFGTGMTGVVSGRINNEINAIRNEKIINQYLDN